MSWHELLALLETGVAIVIVSAGVGHVLILVTVAPVSIIEHSATIELKVGTHIHIGDGWSQLQQINQVLFPGKVSVAVLRHSWLSLSPIIMMMVMVTISICGDILTCS